MRITLEVYDEHVAPLRKLALYERRSVREEASYLLQLKIIEEVARLGSLLADHGDETAA